MLYIKLPRIRKKKINKKIKNNNSMIWNKKNEKYMICLIIIN